MKNLCWENMHSMQIILCELWISELWIQHLCLFAWFLETSSCYDIRQRMNNGILLLLFLELTVQLSLAFYFWKFKMNGRYIYYPYDWACTKPITRTSQPLLPPCLQFIQLYIVLFGCLSTRSLSFDQLYISVPSQSF